MSILLAISQAWKLWTVWQHGNLFSQDMSNDRVSGTAKIGTRTSRIVRVLRRGSISSPFLGLVLCDVLVYDIYIYICVILYNNVYINRVYNMYSEAKPIVPS